MDALTSKNAIDANAIVVKPTSPFKEMKETKLYTLKSIENNEQLIEFEKNLVEEHFQEDKEKITRKLVSICTRLKEPKKVAQKIISTMYTEVFWSTHSWKETDTKAQFCDCINNIQYIQEVTKLVTGVVVGEHDIYEKIKNKRQNVKQKEGKIQKQVQ